MFSLRFLHTRLLPGGRASTPHEDVERLATGWSQAGKLSQVEAVRQPDRPPAASKQGRETLRGAPAGAVRIEDAVDCHSFGERGQSFGWKMHPADRDDR